MALMGLQFGLETNSFENDPSRRTVAKTCLRRFRWLFKIDGISAQGVNALPPSQAARPSLSFNEIEARHITENMYYPGRPDWRPINLVLYDVVKTNGDGARFHPVFDWMEKIYVPEKDASYKTASEGLIKECDLEMLSGCGEVVERWIFENVWPQAIDFGTLDMANAEIVTCDLTLRYARAYIVKGSS